MCNANRWLAVASLLAALAFPLSAAEIPALRAYPDPVPEDTSFDDVVNSQPFPPMKYAVPIIGAKCHPEEVHVTPSGALVFPRDGQWKGLYLAVLLGSRPPGEAEDIRLELPAAEQTTAELVDGYMPGVINTWTAGEIKLRQVAFATAGGQYESKDGREPFVALVRYTLTNKSAAPRQTLLAIQFGEALPGHSLKQVPPVYPDDLSFHPPYVLHSGRQPAACLLSADLKASFKPLPASAKAEPSRSFMFNNTQENRLQIELSLAPGESKIVDLAVPYYPDQDGLAALLDRLVLEQELARFREFWGRELNRTSEFIVPEGRIRDAYRACVANNLLLTDRDPKTGVLMPHPDPTQYEYVWGGDSGVIIQAMDRLGYHAEAAGMLDFFLAKQSHRKPDGDVSSAEGAFSGDAPPRWMNDDGFILWAMAEHYKLTHDEAWLRRVAPQLVKGCDWIVRERARTKVMENGRKPKHYGLMPKGAPSDIGTWDYWYWTDTYSYMGLRGTADVLGAAGMTDAAARLAKEADDYRACILDSVERSIDPKIAPPFVPASPSRTGPPSAEFFNQTWYSICSPIYMVEAGLLDARGERAGGINYWLEKYGLYSGMAAFGTGSVDPYYVYNQSLVQLLRGEAGKFDWTLYSIVAYAMGPGTYATIEGHNLVTGYNGEAWDANRQPHMHSNSRFLDLVRIALLLEDGDTLHMLAGTPRGWLADGQAIEIKRAPSTFGEVNLSARSRIGSGQVSFEIDPPQWRPAKVVLHVRAPTQVGPVKTVKVNGREWKEFGGQAVRLGRIREKTRVSCGF